MEEAEKRRLTDMPASSLLKRRKRQREKGRTQAPPQLRKVVMVNYWDVTVYSSLESPEGRC